MSSFETGEDELQECPKVSPTRLDFDDRNPEDDVDEDDDLDISNAASNVDVFLQPNQHHPRLSEHGNEETGSDPIHQSSSGELSKVMLKI